MMINLEETLQYQELTLIKGEFLILKGTLYNHRLKSKMNEHQHTNYNNISNVDILYLNRHEKV
jgi:hypothetical protein